MKTGRPTIGLALSGGSGRAITHIGVLEVLRENSIPIDYITACSSGALIAASYACGTIERLKEDWLRMDRGFLWTLLELNKNGKGILGTEKAEAWASKYFADRRFEDVKPPLGFVCADIVTGEPVLLSLGEIAKAVRASCTVPGLFEPVEWGNRLLIDGGLFSIIPTAEARKMGADIVIGVDIAATRYMFKKRFYHMRKGYNFFKRSLPFRLYASIHEFFDQLFTKSVDFIYYNQSDTFEETEQPGPGMFSILGKAIDISLAQSEKRKDFLVDCDFLLSPQVKHLGKTDMESAAEMLEEGRRVTREAIPAIKKLISDYEWRAKQPGRLNLQHV
jgi:NTE family protein